MNEENPAAADLEAVRRFVQLDADPFARVAFSPSWSPSLRPNMPSNGTLSSMKRLE